MTSAFDSAQNCTTIKATTTTICTSDGPSSVERILLTENLFFPFSLFFPSSENEGGRSDQRPSRGRANSTFCTAKGDDEFSSFTSATAAESTFSDEVKMINGQFIYTFGVKHVNGIHSVELAKIKARRWGHEMRTLKGFFQQTGKHLQPRDSLPCNCRGCWFAYLQWQCNKCTTFAIRERERHGRSTGMS